MNIWIFNQYAHGPDLPGGTRHYDLGRELVRRGHRVTIFATSFHHYLHRETRLQLGERWKIEDLNGVRFVWIRTPPYRRNDWRRVRNMAIFALRAWRLGRRLPKLMPDIEKPDVVIGSSPHLLTPLAAYKVARSFRAPFVMEVRDLWPQSIIEMGELSDRSPIVKLLCFLEIFLYKRAARIIELGPQIEKYITHLGIGQGKIVWIPNGVDLTRFGCVGGTTRDGFTVMYMGAHGQANSLDVLVHAAKIFQEKGFHDIHVVLIGDGPEKPRLMALSKSLNLRNIEFRDPVPKTKVPKVLSEAHVLTIVVHPRFFTSGGSLNKFFDYLAAGKPILFTAPPNKQITASAEINLVEEARCGLTVPPQDPNALAEAILKLYRMPPEEREAMGRRGREYVEKHHAIPVLADKLEKSLKELVPTS